MSHDASPLLCASCQSSNLRGVKFCAQCGARLVPQPATAQAQPVEPLQQLSYALSRTDVRVVGGDGRSVLEYQCAYPGGWMAGPIKPQFAGSIRVQPGATPGFDVVARMMPQSLALQFGLCVAGAVVLGFIPKAFVPNEMFIGAVAIALGLTAWIAFFDGPKRVRERISKIVDQTLAGAAVAAPVQSAAPAPIAGNDAADVFGQLERLAQMQATGLLTADEVAAKKADLLRRI
jgi:hypothetical protein